MDWETREAPSDWLPSYIKAAPPIFDILKWQDSFWTDLVSFYIYRIRCTLISVSTNVVWKEMKQRIQMTKWMKKNRKQNKKARRSSKAAKDDPRKDNSGVFV